MKGNLLSLTLRNRLFWRHSSLRLYWTAHDARVLRLEESGKLPGNWKD